MYQVLLVDDEALARNDVKSMLDWEKHGFTLCGEAYNGSMALAMMEQHTPHIAIMDVSMPVMNGVELSLMIRERFPKVKMIMLSSFDDYDYVRACLMNGAMDYLLKHRLTQDALVTLLDKAVQQLQMEEREQDVRSTQTQMMERLSPDILREYVANLARDVQGAGEQLYAYARDNHLFPHSINYGVAAVQIVPFLLLTELFTDVEKNRFVQRAMDVMQMAIGDSQTRTVGYVGEGRFIVLFSSVDRSEHTVTTQMSQALNSLSHSMGKFLNLTCIYAIGPLYGSLRQLAASYSRANQVMNEIYYQDMQTSTLRDPLFMEERKQLQLFLEQLDWERTNQIISTIFAGLASQPVYAISVQLIVSEMLHLADRSVKRHVPRTSFEEAGLPSRNELGQLRSIADLEMWSLAYYARIMENIKKQHAGGTYSRHILKAVQFISDHYASNNISLEITANALNLHPSYLSRLFKEETQMTFSEYLNRVRIKTSCMLMESGRIALKQISLEVGFLNYTYFFKVFKTITGLTPQAYIDSLKPSKK
ncbi:response regulator [Paenibacillus alba]|uniref:response regulator n=1 Tax=Paenibacillus alba TaxID=1197127 RepID=UPI001563F5DE|nr:response regulator [Paenibacillus alba]NQX67557.1 response regulator [Paenibacillus alba]